MKPINVLIIAENQELIKYLKLLLEQLRYNCIGAVHQLEDAQNFILKEKPDVLLIFIEFINPMPSLLLAQQLLQQHHDLPQVFLAHEIKEALLDSLKLMPPPLYLIKPSSKDDLRVSIELAIHNFKTTPLLPSLANDSLLVKIKNSFYKVKFSEILYLKSNHVYVTIHTIDEKEYNIRGSIRHFLKHLPAYFFRTHRSYIANLDIASCIHQHTVVINGQEIPIGKNYRAKILNYLNLATA